MEQLALLPPLCWGCSVLLILRCILWIGISDGTCAIPYVMAGRGPEGVTYCSELLLVRVSLPAWPGAGNRAWSQWGSSGPPLGWDPTGMGPHCWSPGLPVLYCSDYCTVRLYSSARPGQAGASSTMTIRQARPGQARAGGGGRWERRQQARSDELRAMTYLSRVDASTYRT